MEQPPDFVAQGELGKVWRLKNSLYGESSHQELGLDDLSLLFGFLIFLFSEGSLCVLATTSREDVTPCNVCG